MLRNLKDLRGYAIRATDGNIGKVDDFYFDDEDWRIRYLVVDTGSWLSGRKVLISPNAVGRAGWMARRLPVALTRSQVERSPDVDHLRSSNAVTGHYLAATDGEIGHLEDFLVDDRTWTIRYLVVNTSNWWSGPRVLITPERIRGVRWSEARVSVDLTRQAVKESPRLGSSDLSY